jgi:NAD(P)-dependent dehydrogenase (short-subunit alcohol dehydrogenase family)
MGVNNLFNLKEKTALVTGSSQGIGRCIALALAEHGANVVVNYRSHDELAEKVKKEVSAYGVKCWLWKYDLLSSTITRDFNNFRTKHSLSIDVLVLNASIQIRKEWNEVTIEEFDRQMDVNVRASLELVQCCELDMEKRHWGRIVTLGSVQQYRPSRQMIVYAASKAAQRNMVKSLATFLGSKGITVNNLAPGTIATVRNKEVLADENFRKQIESKIPLDYIGHPNELASMALLLCSDAGSYVTGDDILVDGGMNLPQ